jgi:zinc protease
MGINFPEGTGKKTIHRGIEQKSMVQLCYTGTSSWSESERLLLQALNSLMQIKLRESLREDESGTYGVGCNGIINRVPNNYYIVNVQFQCDPQNAEKLVAAANDVISTVQQNGCSDEDLTKVIEGMRRSRETSLKENNYWASVLGTTLLYGNQPLSDAEFEKIISGINSATLQAASKLYYNPAQKQEFVLLPEEK